MTSQYSADVSVTILIFGGGGQVGRALKAHFGEKAVRLDRGQVDLADIAAVERALETYRPEAVFNAAAYTQVDKAETERELAFAVNAAAPGAMARWCAQASARLVHYSTDYVFDGSGSAARGEEAEVGPLNIYGASKLAGEDEVLRAGGKCTVFRTSWVYDSAGKNFFTTMLRLGREREELRVVADQFGAPTYAPQLAVASAKALEGEGGLYHLCHSGEVSWHGFAEAIFARAEEGLIVKRVAAITTEDYPAPAKRPLNSRLDCTKARMRLGIQLPAWQEGLNACMKQYYAGH